MRIAVALGGNALVQAGERGTHEEQMQKVRVACRQLAELTLEHELVITHGNGPQIGKLRLQNELARFEIPALPLDVCGAMTQGQIGYMLQQQLGNELSARGINKDVMAVVTQVLVDAADPSMQKPTKPIGSFYTREEAQRFIREKKEVWVEDSGRGWRKVVPSPKPLDILEKRSVRNLLDSGNIVIAAGGGGIPVVACPGGYCGIEAVIDKDLAGELLARIVEADIFVILTDVPHVYLNYGRPEQVKLEQVPAAVMAGYEEGGHFAAGSMGPKVRAAVSFAGRTGKRAIITSLDSALHALKGEAGTHIIP